MPEPRTNSSERYYISPNLFAHLKMHIRAYEEDALSSGQKDSNQIQYLLGKVEAARNLLYRIYTLADNRDELPDCLQPTGDNQ